MVASSFPMSLDLVLVHEGGYSNHPADPGGPTMKGVIQRVYDAYRRGKALPTRSVKMLEDAELREIYRRQYWDAVRGDDLPAGIDYCVFDAAVNSGPAQAAKWLQRALGVSVDGQVGAVTLEAARANRDPAAAVANLCDRRLAMLRTLKTWPVFGSGWARRVADVRRVASSQALGKGAAPPAVPVSVAGAVAALAPLTAKAPVSSALPLPNSGPAAAAAAAGAVAASIGEAVRQLSPLAGMTCRVRR